MSSQRKFILIICFVFIDILLFSGILLISNITLKNMLITEVASLVKYDIINNNYKSDVKCLGGYGVVESSIEDFFSNYSFELKNTLNGVDEKELISLINVNNNSNIINNIEILNNIKDNFNKDVESLINEDIEFIYDRIYEGTDNKFYIELYNDLLYDDVAFKFDNTKNYLELKRAEKNDYIDSLIDKLENSLK